MKTQIRSPNKKPCWVFHKFIHKKTIGVNTYYECIKCNTRQVIYPDTGYQPLNCEWMTHNKKYL